MTATVLLILLLALAVWFDARTARIPNHLTAGAVIGGLALSLAPGGIGFVDAAGGLVIGLAALLPLYAVRAMGAGDVKLMAAAGSFLGASATFAAVIYTFVLGGLLAIGYAWRAGVLRQMLANLRVFAYASAARVAGRSLPSVNDLALTRARAPFALAIAGGALVELLTRFLGGGGA